MTLFEIIIVVLLAAILLLLILLRLRKAELLEHEHPEVIQIGTPGLFGKEFAVKLMVQDPQESFKLELPGGISQVGSSYVGEIIPMGVIEIRGNDTTNARSAVLHFSEDDIKETDKALSVFAQYKQEVPKEFSILTEVEDVSYEEIIRGSDEKRFGKDSPVPVQMRVRMRYEGHAQIVVSNPFKGWLVPLSQRGPGGYEGETEGSHIFDCHSHWYHFFFTGRHTLCHGPCPPGQTCLTWWNRKEWEEGWCICSC